MQYGISRIVYVTRVLGLFLRLLTFTHPLTKIRDWWNLQPNLQRFGDHKWHYGLHKRLFVFKSRYGLQLYYAHDCRVLPLLLMEANLHSGEANNKNLGCLKNVSSMNPLFRVLRTCFFMVAEIDWNANKDWRSPIQNFSTSGIQLFLSR